MLSLFLIFPLCVALILLAIPPSKYALFRWVTVAVSLIQIVFCSILWIHFDASHQPTSWLDAFHFITKIPWIRWNILGMGSLNVDFFIGVDGISLPLLFLTSIVFFIGAVSSFTINRKVKMYHILFLLLYFTIMGCFVSLDLFLFYVFFEFMLLPMFFLIGIWGGKKREYASVKFLIYTLLGSLFILIVMIGLYASVTDNGNPTFSFIHLFDKNSYHSDGLLAWETAYSFLGYSYRQWAFWLLFLGFIIKLPSVPFHTWLPDAHVEAPTPISIILAGVLLKIGGYGIYRMVFLFFPDQVASHAMIIAVLGIVSIIYGGMVATGQTDFKKMIAYSSVSHMGFVLVGLASFSLYGFSGGLFQLFSHGILSAGLFLLVGFLYDRTQNRDIENFSGLASSLPLFTFFSALLFFASFGLPGLSGFVGEVLVLMGAFQSPFIATWIGVCAVMGIFVSAIYFIWTLQRMYFGKYWVRNSEWQENMKDVNIRELILFVTLAVLTIILGIFPQILLNKINNSLHFWVEFILNNSK